MTEPIEIEALARRAIEGDRTALEALAVDLQRTIYPLALRMLWNRADAEDATQEILIRVLTRLAGFDFRSQLNTWVYRVAVNYLLDVKKSAVERMSMSFVEFSKDLSEGLSDDGPDEHDRSVLVEEVKIGCTMAMLQCLDRPHRLTYILGEILDLSGPEAAAVLELDAATFRKRLERARSAILDFSKANCGLVADSAACRCNRRVPAALQLGRVRADSLQFAEQAVSFKDVKSLVSAAHDARTVLQVHRSNHPHVPVTDLLKRILDKIDQGSTTPT